MTSSAGPIVAFGELLLRLKAPGHSRLLQEASLEATFGGAEFNVLASLSRFGADTKLVSVLPDNALGAMALEQVRALGVDARHVHSQGGRMGVYFLEAGADLRPGRVIYDRADSAFTRLDPARFDWADILRGARWLHLTGITAALGDAPHAALVEAARTACRTGVPVSFDVNARPTLWAGSRRPARELIRPLLEMATVIFAGVDDCHVCFDATGADAPMDIAAPEFLNHMLAAYPRAEAIISSLRRADTVENQEVSAIAAVRSLGLVEARKIRLSAVVDRVGTGDAFVAGCLHNLIKRAPWQSTLDFAVAASALKHTIPGDINRTSLEEIEAVLAGRGGGRLLR